MSNIEFENKNVAPLLYSKFQRSQETPFIIRIIMKTKLVKDEQQALYVAVGLIIAFILLSVFLLIWVNKEPTITTVPALLNQ
ncbi:MAG: hypothetical protein RL094_283 [Candidatus Parcubacteria bacterium]|jgi:hypothetical protein